MRTTNSITSALNWSGIKNLSTGIISLLRLFILSRLLEPSDFGLLAITQVFLSFANLFVDSGTTVGYLHRLRVSAIEFSSLVWWNTGIALTLYLVYFALAPLFARFYQEEALLEIIPVLGLLLPITGLGLQFRLYQQKRLNFQLISKISVIASLLSLVVSTVLALMGWSVYALIIGQLMQTLLTTIWYILSVPFSYGISIRFSQKAIVPYLKMGIFHTFGQLLNTLTRDLDIIIFGKAFGTETVGIYSLLKQLAARPAQMVNPVITSVMNTVLPRLQVLPLRLSEAYRAIVGLITSINAPLYLGAIVLAPDLIYWAYGQEYATKSYLFQILCLYFLLRSLVNPVGTLIIAKGRTDLDLYWNLGSAIGFTLLLSSSPFFGLNQIIWLFVVFGFIQLVFSYIIFVGPLAGLSANSYFRTLAYPIVLAAVMAGILFLIDYTLPNQSSLPRLIVLTVIGMVSYWLLGAISQGFAWPKNQLNQLNQIVTNVN